MVSEQDDPVDYGLRWTRDLESAVSPAERLAKMQDGLHAALVADRDGVPGGRDLVRVVLRRLGDDLANGRLPDRLPADSERDAQHLVRALLEVERTDLEELSRALARKTDPMDFVRRSPRAAGALREVAGIVARLGGTGVLTMEDPAVVRDLRTFADALTARSRRSLATVPEHLRITRDDLLRWADASGGDELPGLIRRLVMETSESLEHLHFPDGSGVSSGGWDGVVSAAVASPFVPEGTSAWELSVDKNSNEKAESDYQKRVADSGGLQPADVTYVQVICRPWLGARAFASKGAEAGHWKSVRAYNVDDLETWLEHAMSATIWFAEKLRRPVDGLQTAEDWWDGWLESTTTALNSAVVLAGREQQAEEIRAALSSPGVKTLGGDIRLEDALAVIAAAVAEPPLTDHDPGSGVIFASQLDQARQLLSRPGELSLVLPGPEFLHGVRVTPGHRIIVPVIGSDRTDIVISPIAAGAAAQALEHEGIPSRAAWELGALARRSLLALRRQLAINPLLHQPSWAAPGADTITRRALMANAWNQSAPGDREALEQMMGVPYDEVEHRLRVLSETHDEPMLALLDERWHVVSPMDTWLLLGRQLTAADLDSFRRLALEVLLAPDPLQNLDAAERWAATIRGVSRPYSAELARGIARSLALAGVADEAIRPVRGQTGGMIAAMIVRELLVEAADDLTAARWHLLAPHLPLLAEAAPRVVIDALRQALAEGAPLAREVFADAEPDQFGSPKPSPHTHVLWALENLAWSGEYFDAAVSLLARMAEIDPGGRWSNRPAASLSSIFRPWHPNTSASLDMRVASLERLRRRHPTVGWNLLLSMLGTEGAHLTHVGPEYRDWKTSDPIVTTREYAEAFNVVGRALLEDAGSDPGRWRAIITHLREIPRELLPLYRQRLRSIAESGDFGDSGVEVWEELRAAIAEQREYADARWALPSAEVDELETLALDIAPQTAHERYGYLFQSSWITLGDQRRRDDLAAYDAEVAARRDAAVAEIVAGEGVDELTVFALSCPLPNEVGASLARLSGDEFLDAMLLHADADNSDEVTFALGFLAARFGADGWPWVDDLLALHDDLSPGVVSRLLRAARDPLAAADRAESLNPAIADDFWRHFVYFGLGHDFAAFERVADHLIAVGRNAAALDFLALYVRQNATSADFAAAIARAFDGLRSSSDDPEMERLSQHEISVLLQVLSAHGEVVGREWLIEIEWYFLPLLGYEPDARTLHQALAENPLFFADVVSMVYRSRQDSAQEVQTEPEKAAAENAFRLLSSWAICPGSEPSGGISSSKLSAWVSEARTLLSARGRGTIGDEQIGQALASAPADDNGTWPCKPVRDLLEDLQNDAIDRGFEIRIANNRGVTSRSPDAGGQLERELADRYLNQAEQLTIQSPRVAEIFRRLAASYAVDARREDASAERRRRGLD